MWRWASSSADIVAAVDAFEPSSSYAKAYELYLRQALDIHIELTAISKTSAIAVSYSSMLLPRGDCPVAIDVFRF